MGDRYRQQAPDEKYDKDGKFLAQFGSVGTDEGRFNEPVGLAIDPSGNIYVADTWNQRIQKFDASLKLLRGRWRAGRAVAC